MFRFGGLVAAAVALKIKDEPHPVNSQGTHTWDTCEDMNGVENSGWMAKAAKEVCKRAGGECTDNADFYYFYEQQLRN